MRKEFSNLLIIAVIAIFLGACAKKSSTVQGPQILAGAPLIAEQYELVQLEGGISSTNLMVENVKWQQISGPSVSINNQTSLNANFNAPAVQTATVVSFELRITFNDKSVSTDAVSITVYKQLFSVSGVVSAADFTTVDSDLNDPYSNSISNNNTNDNFTDAQIIESPVQVGGFLTASPTGYSDDNFGASVDTKDFYKVDLLAGEEVAMIVSDTVDFDLFLYDSAEAEVDSSESGNQFEQVVAPSDGTYYIGVKVWTGTGTYLLSVAENIRIDEFDGSGVSRLSAHDDFVPNEWLVVPKLSINTALAKSGSNKVGSNKVGSNKAENYQLIKSSSLQLTAQKSVSMPLDRPAALIDKAETINKLKQLMATGDYETVELNYNYHPSIVPPNDTSYGDQWNYPLINMLTAWDTTSGANAIIAVIDTGVVLTHPDLAANLIQGYDFISSTSNSNDGNGIDADPTDPGDSQTPGESSFHGTHVSGTIAAVTDNNEGVSGIAYSAKVMPLRVLGLNGGTTNDIVQAIRYATGLPNTSGTIPANPADVINMSLGSPSSSSIFQAAITDAVAERVIVVAAAGNNGTSYKSYPGAYDGVISVSAVDRDSELASYSSYGKTIDVTAPGGDLDKNDLVVGDVDGIISTSADDSSGNAVASYSNAMGTSMASPHVAAVAALMKSVYPGLTPAKFNGALLNGELTQDLPIALADGLKVRNDFYGYGLIDASKAVDYAALLNAGTLIPATIAANQNQFNLGYSDTSLTANMTLYNAGEVAFSVTSIVINNAWITSVVATDVDVETKLGEYAITIDRTGLAVGQTNGWFTVNTDTPDSLTIYVSVSKMAARTQDNDVGFQWLLLVDNASGNLVNWGAAPAVGGSYTYQIKAPPGTFSILSGSDLDNNYVISDSAGESYGEYLNVTVTSSSLTGLNFISSFDTSILPSQSLAVTKGLR